MHLSTDPTLRPALQSRTLPTAPTKLARTNFKNHGVNIQCNPAVTVSLQNGSSEGLFVEITARDAVEQRVNMRS